MWESLIKEGPRLLEAAAKSPWGMVSLIIFLLALLIAYLLRDAGRPARLTILVVLVVSFVSVIFVVARNIFEAPPHKDQGWLALPPDTAPPQNEPEDSMQDILEEIKAKANEAPMPPAWTRPPDSETRRSNGDERPRAEGTDSQ